MSSENIQRFYNAWPGSRGCLAAQQQVDSLAPFFEKNGCCFFLDLGCYTGDKTILLRDFIGAKLAIGIDFFSPALGQAKREGIQAVAFDLNQEGALPFPGSSFDCIHLGEVIEHVFSPDWLLIEVARLLKPGGYAIITTPNLASWRNRLVLLLGWQPFETEVSTARRVGNPRAPEGPLAGHIRMFVPRALAELAAHYGLRVERVGGRIPSAPVTTLTRILSILDRILLRVRPTLADGIVLKVRR